MKKVRVSGQMEPVAPIFEGVPPREVAYLLRHGKLIHYTFGETILSVGEIPQCLYVVVHGEIGLYDGNRLTRVCRTGDTFCEAGILGPRPMTQSAIAMTKSDVFRLSGESLQRLLSCNRGSRIVLNAVSMVSTPVSQGTTKTRRVATS